MKILAYVGCMMLLIGIVSCGASPDKKIAEVAAVQSTETDKALAESSRDIDVINTVYDKFVFAIDCSGDELNNPEKYFTANALKKLQEDYTFDCDDGACYAYYALRTEAQDSKPGTDGASQICNIEPIGDGRYIVSYSDMGWPGQTRIRISDGKIDNYERIGTVMTVSE